jgi:hypothetical protein
LLSSNKVILLLARILLRDATVPSIINKQKNG